jgi:hypothetical protein
MMSEHFNAYHKWLAIPPKAQPPNHYRLLGLELFESDLDVISDAAEQRIAHVRTYQLGKYMALSQQILNELAAARACLLNPDKKAAYDRMLEAKLLPLPPSPAAQATESSIAAGTGGVGDSLRALMRSMPSWTPWAMLSVGGLAAVIVVMVIANSGRVEGEKGGEQTVSMPSARHSKTMTEKMTPKPERETKGESKQKAGPEPKIEPSPELMESNGWLPLADTLGAFRQHWRQGNDAIDFFFDATSKTIIVTGSGNLGGLACPRKWKEFYCEIEVSYLSFGHFDLAVKQARFKLGEALGKLPAKASLRVRLADESGNAVVLLNGVRVSQVRIPGPNWTDSFDCTFSSDGGGNAKLQLKNILLLVDGNDSQLPSDWMPPQPNSPESEPKAQPVPVVEPKHEPEPELAGRNDATIPQIVRMNPPNNAKNVNPMIRELRVTFNVPMAGSYSLCRRGTNFPKTAGSPRWTADHKTCVLPVELMPGQNYWLGLNGPSFKGFRSQSGIALEPVEYRFTTRRPRPKR